MFPSAKDSPNWRACFAPRGGIDRLLAAQFEANKTQPAHFDDQLKPYTDLRGRRLTAHDVTLHVLDRATLRLNDPALLVTIGPVAAA